MDNQIISIIIAIILVLLCGIIVYCKYKFSPKEEDKQAAKDFLVQLKDELYETILNIIINFDYNNYDSLEDIEIQVINDIVNTCRECINKELEDSKDMLSVLILKCLNSNMIEDFIMNILEEFKVVDLVDNKILEVVESKYDTILEEDATLAEKFKDHNTYNEDEMDELPAAEEEIVPEEELEKLNPQNEDEEEFNNADSSMEVIDDDIYFDASGRARSKTTGKWVKL